ncbi:MAG: tRNA dihydrouridine synthase [Planctomycetota bacterium]|jgi:nifR3 family TIM-barrel protein
MQAPPPLTISGRGRSVTFPTAMLLAPMEGITDRVFRDLVLELGSVGGACTEFQRISSMPLPAKLLRRELGPARDVPVGMQLMAPEPEHIAATVETSVSVGAPWIDLNFGCPVRRVFSKCAGSALLDYPDRLGAIVAAAVGATEVPVSAKIRAGVEDDVLLEDVLHAAAEAGAAMIALHARLRTDSYADPANWQWIATAAEVLHRDHPDVPLVGNGGVDTASDVGRMLRETGCDGVMIGRAAFANPWIFREAAGGAPATRDEATAFVLRYFELLLEPGRRKGGVGRVKQCVKAWAAGGLFEGREEERIRLLRSRDGAEVVDGFRALVEEPAVAAESLDDPVSG